MFVAMSSSTATPKVLVQQSFDFSCCKHFHPRSCGSLSCDFNSHLAHPPLCLQLLLALERMEKQVGASTYTRLITGLVEHKAGWGTDGLASRLPQSRHTPPWARPTCWPTPSGSTPTPWSVAPSPLRKRRRCGRRCSRRREIRPRRTPTPAVASRRTLRDAPPLAFLWAVLAAGGWLQCHPVHCPEAQVLAGLRLRCCDGQGWPLPPVL